MRLIKSIVVSLMAMSIQFSQAATLNSQQALTEAPPMSLFELWNAPIEPFKIFNHVYYVGTENLSSVLFDTGAGLVLIDSGIDQSAVQIKSNIEKLGFKITDVKYLLNSHARLDQAGGFAKLKQWSGAKLIASAENAKMLANGASTDFALGNQLPFPPVKADLIFKDGEQLKLGQQVFTAHATPGHLPGATSWTTEVQYHFKHYQIIYADSLFTGGYHLLNNKNYPHIVTDMQKTFQTLNAIHADIFLANKADRFNMKQKLVRLKAGDQNAFIDPDGLQNYVAKGKVEFEQQLQQQQSLAQLKTLQ
ncbi:HARLDQ motif MBL-fold protein [Acinetobacter bereziniae]|uniref:HARLDQ motif MBL-fold protein n=1 Tax=Acinetobacter bereziniae TaxID=106648 RepID=UPI00124FAD75|nr:HARLDQ motif MBL-fold protein [Acinetobacter bereziniae]MDA3440482.1 HARLDQ motif MBL-fold protein [Acinetobacter bereziniae]